MKRWVQLFFILFIATAWLWLLNIPLGSAPSFGFFLNPVKGFWVNAEKTSAVGGYKKLPFDNDKRFGEVSFNNRLVPHIKAADDEHLYFTLGYLHAHYRLWQMDMQTRAAAGRISEVIGAKGIEFDRKQRRKGMLWAAENSLRAMEDHAETKKILDAYTNGVNYFISSIEQKDFPLEYKLMSFEPEPWTNLKVALLLKYMADDLTGNVDDIAMSYLRTLMPEEEIDKLFPDFIDDSKPVIPAGTHYQSPSLHTPDIPKGDLFATFEKPKSKVGISHFQEKQGIGSNNWAVGKTLTADSSAVLSNDPHLGLNLPCIWYEVQLTAPGINCYGVSIPGAPGVIIGFNDSISWGFTNNYRDVKDYYEIREATTKGYYIFDNEQKPYNYRYERIKIKGTTNDFVDTVKYTLHGPVMYEPGFPEPGGSSKLLATTWMAHKATNEMRAVYQYNRAHSYQQFVTAIQYFECPAQNFAYADRQGNIAIWGQGTFINKWKGQGKFVMRGDISATLWGTTIPVAENPHVFNPAQGYVASANQTVTDTQYPYWYNGDFSEFRSWAINGLIKDDLWSKSKDAVGENTQWYPFLPSKNTTNLTDIDKSAALQNSNLSILNGALIQRFQLMEKLGVIVDEKNTALLNADSKWATAMQIFWSCMYKNTWEDDFANLPVKIYPSPERTLQLILQDSNSKYFDNTTTNKKETLLDIVALSVQQTKDSVAVLRAQNKEEWYKVKNTSVMHLAKLSAFSYEGLMTGGWGNVINAMKYNHGPSWRMIVKMNKNGIDAKVVYPGGQSGNPGSAYYSNFIPYWVTGKYYAVDFK